MLKKKGFLTALGVACIAVMSLSVLVYAATWTPEQLADWMYNVGRHKIWRTNYIVKNEIKPMVEDIQDKMGQGLVGEWIKGEATTVGREYVTLWSYEVPSDNPKKVSLWIHLEEMSDGDKIFFFIKYASKATSTVYTLEDTPTRKFTWHFIDSQPRYGKLIIDELPVATKLVVIVWQSEGTPFTIYWQAIIEEM